MDNMEEDGFTVESMPMAKQKPLKLSGPQDIKPENKDKPSETILRRRWYNNRTFVPTVEIPTYRVVETYEREEEEIERSRGQLSSSRSVSKNGNGLVASPQQATDTTPNAEEDVGNADISEDESSESEKETNLAPPTPPPSSASKPSLKRKLAATRSKDQPKESSQEDGDEDSMEEEESESLSLVEDMSEDDDDSDDELDRKRARIGNQKDVKMPSGATPKEEEGEGATRAPRRIRRHGSSSTARYTELAKEWDEKMPFSKRMVPNFLRLGRILEKASQVVGQDEEEENNSEDENKMVVDPPETVQFTREAIPMFAYFVKLSFSHIVDSATKSLKHRKRKRINPEDLRMAIRQDPTLHLFDFDEVLARFPDQAPALVGFADNLRVGKSNSKTNRCTFQHENQDFRVDEKDHKKS
jgi:hypothetical protein